MEKRKEIYALAAIKAAFKDPTVLNRTFSATEGAEDLGMSDAEVVAVVQALTKADFEKSMTSYADCKSWQDVYRPIVRGAAVREIHARRAERAASDQLQEGLTMRNPRHYPPTMPSAESGRPMTRGEKALTIRIDGQTFTYNQPGWWCSLTDPDDLEGQLVDGDNQVREMARRTAKAMAAGESVFVPAVIRAIRELCGLSQRDAGLLFQTGEKSFEKYESGEIKPSGPTRLLLKMAMKHPDWFRRPKKGDRPPSDFDASAEILNVLESNATDHIYAPLFEKRERAETQ